MKFLKYVLKSLLRDRRTLTWSVFFSLSLEFFSIFYLNRMNDINAGLVRQASGLMYSLMLMMSMAFSSVAIGRSFVEQSRSFGYIFRFSKMNGKSYLIQLVGGVATVYIILSGLFVLFTVFMFDMKYSTLVFPRNLAELVLFSMLGGMSILGTTLVVDQLVLKFQGRRNLNFIQFLPVFLYFTFDWAIIEGGAHGSEFYMSPFLSSTYLMINAYGGTSSFWFNVSTPYTVNLLLSVISVVSWVTSLMLLDAFILKGIYLTPEEEERVV
ncbi:hypothetical protein [Sulfuracidifex tepidarius]|uniref:ABC-2 type transporter domain-containing protein n=1 Tax=Sulfuracidifex tepidarius TaxID=1294262 RepID=A0A510DTC3_9CREN|nr:hypothetical protein [Sulfuracidifex tepidarius]BBG23405.1 hypothetical protein IC006_0689 [Sulfuracidifex tepidarius]BBG26157.1 hypothetical protein IC007_0662 [Sulfuracidifex tepidarius]